MQAEERGVRHEVAELRAALGAGLQPVDWRVAAAEIQHLVDQVRRASMDAHAERVLEL